MFMKRLFSILLICFLFLATLGSEAATKKKKKAKKTKIPIEFETRDGVVMRGELFMAPQKKPARPLVVLLHSFGMKSTEWLDLPTDLQKENYNVLALDLRGHGKSVYKTNLKYYTRMKFEKKDWSKNPLDVIQAVDYISKTFLFVDTKTIYMVGADLGANSAVLSANIMKDKPRRLILISPFTNFKGLDIANVVPRIQNIPTFILASRADTFSFGQADIISRLVKSQMKFNIYKQGGSGQLLLKRNPSSYKEIIKFITIEEALREFEKINDKEPQETKEAAKETPKESKPLSSK